MNTTNCGIIYDIDIFFNKDYNKLYECEYLINDKKIEVIINYDINNKIELGNNKIITFKINTKFKEKYINYYHQKK